MRFPAVVLRRAACLIPPPSSSITYQGAARFDDSWQRFSLPGVIQLASMAVTGITWLRREVKSFLSRHVFPNQGFPGGASDKEAACQWRRFHRGGFDPWLEKIPWRRAWQPTSVFLPRESPWTEEPGGLQSTGSQRGGHDWSDLARMHIFPSVMVYSITHYPRIGLKAQPCADTEFRTKI